jgi:hypothetical protein
MYLIFFMTGSGSETYQIISPPKFYSIGSKVMGTLSMYTSAIYLNSNTCHLFPFSFRVLLQIYHETIQREKQVPKVSFLRFEWFIYYTVSIIKMNTLGSHRNKTFFYKLFKNKIVVS